MHNRRLVFHIPGTEFCLVLIHLTRPGGAMKVPCGYCGFLACASSQDYWAASVSSCRVSGSWGTPAPGSESRVCGGLDFAPPKGFSLDPEHSEPPAKPERLNHHEDAAKLNLSSLKIGLSQYLSKMP
jgi:hypothetical protein